MIPIIAGESSGDYEGDIISDMDDYDDRQRGVKPTDTIDDEDYTEASGFILIDSDEDNLEDVYVAPADESSELFEDEIIISGPDETIIEETIETVDNAGNEEIETEIIIQIPAEADNKVPKGESEPRQVDVVVTESAGNSAWYEQKHLLAALIAGAAAGVLFATLVVILCIHRIRKKDEGSYSIDSTTKYHAGFKSSSGEKSGEVYA